MRPAYSKAERMVNRRARPGKKPAPQLMRGGSRFSGKDMRQESSPTRVIFICQACG
jgi:hypothetical protein